MINVDTCVDSYSVEHHCYVGDQTNKPSIAQETLCAKNEEWKAHQTAIQEAYEKLNFSDEIIGILKTDEKALEDGIERIFLRLDKLEGRCLGVGIEKRPLEVKEFLISGESVNESTIYEKLKTHYNIESVGEEALHFYARELGILKFACNNFTTERDKLTKSIKNLCQLFNAAQGERTPRDWVIECRQLLEESLSLPSYMLHKHDEENPYIRLLHELSLASIVKPKVVPVYSSLSQSIKNSVTNTHTSFFDLWNSSRSVLEIPQSEIEQHLFGGPPEEKIKDEENNSGSLYCEKFTHNRVLSVALNIISPRVAQQNGVILRFHALLQTVENQLLNPISDSPYVKLTYSNLQNFYEGQEGETSQAIMKLNDFYPISFSGITVSTNSHFIDLAKEKPPFCEEIKNGLYGELTNDRNFILPKNQIAEKGGYYFPLSKKDEWKKTINIIIGCAYDTIKPYAASVNDTKALVAFGELVRFGIIRYHDVTYIKEITTNSSACRVQLIQMHICKGCVDRGGKTNAGFLWGLSDEGTTQELDIASLMQARAAVTSGRATGAMTKFQALINTITRQEMKEFLKKIEDIADPSGMTKSEGVFLHK